MKPVHSASLAAALLLAAVVPGASGPRRSAAGVLDTFGASLSDRAGLAKLSAEERDALEAILVEVPVLDHVASSAEQYLLEEGWRILALYGAFRDGRQVFQFGALGAEGLLLRPVFENEALPPGFYLVDKMGSIVDVIAPDGETVDYRVEESF